MTVKGYCLPGDVANFLGRTFTPAQEIHCLGLIEKAEAAIDRDTARGWLVGAQTNERVDYPTADVWLRYTPVTTITTITGRSSLGAVETTLVANTDYETTSLEWGRLRVISPTLYDRLLITYTPTPSVPAVIAQAAAELCAWWMQTNLRPDSYGLDSYSLPDLTVRFARSHVQEEIPPSIRRLLDLYRFPVHA